MSAFTSGLRQSLNGSGVNVLTIKPGFVDTPMTAAFKKGALWATPAQVAAGSLALNALLCVLLVPRWGMSGAALAASVSYAASVGLLAWRFARAAGLPLAQVLAPGQALRDDLRTLLGLATGRPR